MFLFQGRQGGSLADSRMLSAVFLRAALLATAALGCTPPDASEVRAALAEAAGSACSSQHNAGTLRRFTHLPIAAPDNASLTLAASSCSNYSLADLAPLVNLSLGDITTSPQQCVECASPASCTANGTCAEGHVGVGCGQCASGYAKYFGKCLSCPAIPPEAAWAVIVGSIVLFLLVVAFFACVHVLDDHITRFKVFVDHLTFLAISLEVKLELPPFFVDVALYVKRIIASVDLVSPECFIEAPWWVRHVGLVSLPFGIVGAALLVRVFLALLSTCSGCRRCCCGSTDEMQDKMMRQRKAQATLGRVYRVFLVALLLVYVPELRALISTFDCIDTPDGTLLLRMDTSVKCYAQDSGDTGKHMLVVYYSIAILIVFTLGLPVYILTRICMMRGGAGACCDEDSTRKDAEIWAMQLTQPDDFNRFARKTRGICPQGRRGQLRFAALEARRHDLQVRAAEQQQQQEQQEAEQSPRSVEQGRTTAWSGGAGGAGRAADQAEKISSLRATTGTASTRRQKKLKSPKHALWKVSPSGAGAWTRGGGGGGGGRGQKSSVEDFVASIKRRAEEAERNCAMRMASQRRLYVGSKRAPGIDIITSADSSRTTPTRTTLDDLVENNWPVVLEDAFAGSKGIRATREPLFDSHISYFLEDFERRRGCVGRCLYGVNNVTSTPLLAQITPTSMVPLAIDDDGPAARVQQRMFNPLLDNDEAISNELVKITGKQAILEDVIRVQFRNALRKASTTSTRVNRLPNPNGVKEGHDYWWVRLLLACALFSLYNPASFISVRLCLQCTAR